MGLKDVGRSGPAWYDAPRRRRAASSSCVEVEAGRTADGLLVRVKGVAGSQQSGLLLAGLLSATPRRPSLVTLDLSGLRFISSLAMSVLGAYRGSVVRAGGRVVLAGDLQPGMREALDRAESMRLSGEVPQSVADSGAQSQSGRQAETRLFAEQS
jgi:hypothetical protein